MSKRQEKKAEEKRIIAEMEDALQEEKAAKAEEKKERKKSRSSYYSSTEPQTVHCRCCKTLMENGVCPTCGFKMYVPMSEEKRNKIKTVTTAIGFVVFIVIFLIIQFSKS